MRESDVTEENSRMVFQSNLLNISNQNKTFAKSVLEKFKWDEINTLNNQWDHCMKELKEKIAGKQINAAYFYKFLQVYLYNNTDTGQPQVIDQWKATHDNDENSGQNLANDFDNVSQDNDNENEVEQTSQNNSSSSSSNQPIVVIHNSPSKLHSLKNEEEKIIENIYPVYWNKIRNWMLKLEHGIIINHLNFFHIEKEKCISQTGQVLIKSKICH